MNQLKVNQHEAIIALYQRGWSKRKIARELGLDRLTVRKYIAAALRSNSPTPQTGSAEGAQAKSPAPQTGSVPSLCNPWRAQIEKALESGLSVQRIYQDLVCAHQFPGSYHSVRRFVLRLRPAVELPFRRLESAPGQELQVDFGQGAWVIENGKRRKTHLFRCVLSCSRKAYSEVVWRQTAESFIRCLENAFGHFGGVTATVVTDNLKAGVIQADWFDLDLNP